MSLLTKWVLTLSAAVIATVAYGLWAAQGVA